MNILIFGIVAFKTISMTLVGIENNDTTLMHRNL